MRIDRFLHCIRLVKSRTLAQGVIETGHVRIDGKRVEKPSEEVRAGSVIALPLRGACGCSACCRCPPPRPGRAKPAPAMKSWELTQTKLRHSEMTKGAKRT